MQTVNRSVDSILLWAVIFQCFVFLGYAQPYYVQIGTLPVSSASERCEVFVSANQTWFSFPYYNSGDLTAVYSARPGTNDSFIWTQTTSFPSRTTYWGRGASDGATLYYTGNIDGVSKYAGIAANGLLGTWQSMSALPNPVGPRGRSLHQAFIYSGKLYVTGGWHGDGLSAYADAYYAQIQSGGALGSFVQTTSLPTGVVCHSATVSPQGTIYVVNDTNVFTAQIAVDGSIGNWTTELTIPKLHHNSGGNTSIALVSNLLAIVEYTNTFICRLNSYGHLDSVISNIANPTNFYQRSVYANNGKIYVTATSGRVYRIDNLPFSDAPAPVRTANATAIRSGVFVVAVNISDGGWGYTNTPVVRLIGGGGSGAQASAVVSNGVVTAVDVLNAGYGYTSAPLVIIDPPFIPNPVLSIAPMSYLEFSKLTLGGVYQLQRSVAWYWSNQPVSFTATNALHAQMVAGIADSEDYRLALNPVPSQAFATATVNYGFVVHATVTSGGSGYVTAPAVSIMGGGGSNAGATATLSGGVVTAVTITNAGFGYTNTPTVRIAPPPAAAVLPTVWPVMRVDSANLAPYHNYQIQCQPSLGGVWGNWDGGPFTTSGVTNSQYLFVTNGLGIIRLKHAP